MPTRRRPASRRPAPRRSASDASSRGRGRRAAAGPGAGPDEAATSLLLLALAAAGAALGWWLAARRRRERRAPKLLPPPRPAPRPSRRAGPARPAEAAILVTPAPSRAAAEPEPRASAPSDAPPPPRPEPEPRPDLQPSPAPTSPVPTAPEATVHPGPDPRDDAPRDDLRAADQAARQAEPPDTGLRQDLDFGPFAQALDAFLADEPRARALAALADGATIPELQAALAAGRLQAEELLLLCLARIRRKDAKLGSVIALDPQALDRARALDAARAAGAEAGPLHGIPILLKDNIGTAGLPTTAGAAALAGACADADAFLVRRLRAAGALVLGKANLTEWANVMSSRSVNGYSALGGQCRNPRGPFDVGGSSSGSAAAVAAGLAIAAVGTETSGSLVSPAAQNGVCTLKPSLGLVSRDRVIPITQHQDTAGPVTRCVADLAVLSSVLGGAADVADPLWQDARALHGTDFAAVLDADALRGLRLGAVRGAMGTRRGDEAVAARARGILAAAGATVVDVALPEPRRPIEIWPVFEVGLREGLARYLAEHARDASLSSLADVVAFNAEDPARRAPQGQDRLEAALASTRDEAEAAAQARANRARAIEALHRGLRGQGVDLLLSLDTGLTGLYAAAGFPALCVPAGQRPSGEPVGLTFVGDLLSESRLFGAAFAFERLAGRMGRAAG